MFKKISLFVVTGTTSALLNIAVFFAFNTLIGLHYLLSGFFSFLIATIVHFLFQKILVFGRKESGTSRAESILFVSAVLLNIVLNQITLYIFVSFFSMVPIIAQFISLVLLACLNFVLYERYIFNMNSRAVQAVQSWTRGATVLHVVIGAVVVIWIAAHIPGIQYGTHNIPLHQSYIGDEQSPVNGALHILNDKNILAIKNLENLYYGPFFALLAIPPILVDFAHNYASGSISTAEDYKNKILFDWGGIVTGLHVTATISSIIALIFVYILFSTKTFNPQRSLLVSITPVVLIAFNYYFFEYSHFFKHWNFVLTLLIISVFAAVRITEVEGSRTKYWLLLWAATVLNFGISYIGIVYLIFFAPSVTFFFVAKDWARVKEFVIYTAASLASFGVLFLWHPYAFLRLLNSDAFVILGGEDRITPLAYYTDLLLRNHAFLFIPILIVLVLMVRKRVFSPFVLGFLLTAIINFVIFVRAPRYEGRYMLMSIVFLIFSICVALVMLYNRRSLPRLALVAITASFVFGVCFHTAVIGQWIRIYYSDHPETGFIRDLTEWQRNHPDQQILLLTDYLIGVIHTKEGYHDYVTNTLKTDVNLYKEILAAEYPPDVTPLDIRYYYPVDYTIEGKGLEKAIKFRQKLLLLTNVPWRELNRQYGFIAYEFRSRLEPNQFDYFDQNIMNIFYFDELYEKFIVVKQ